MPFGPKSNGFKIEGGLKIEGCKIEGLLCNIDLQEQSLFTLEVAVLELAVKQGSTLRTGPQSVASRKP